MRPVRRAVVELLEAVEGSGTGDRETAKERSTADP
jgi:hypothetical protein